MFSNKITYEGRIDKTGEGDFKGEFLMNPLRLDLGDGYQYHETYDGFNFPKLLIKDKNVFFIQTNFVQPKKPKEGEVINKANFDIFHKGYIWVKR